MGVLVTPNYPACDWCGQCDCCPTHPVDPIWLASYPDGPDGETRSSWQCPVCCELWDIDSNGDIHHV